MQCELFMPSRVFTSSVLKVECVSSTFASIGMFSFVLAVQQKVQGP